MNDRLSKSAPITTPRAAQIGARSASCAQDPIGAEPGDASATPICPACGYDLRGIALARCPECGFDVAQLGTATSDIPWANRRQLGRVRAYVLTVWRISFRSRWLRTEMSRSQSLSDARRFWLITSLLLSIAPITVYFTTWRTQVPTLFKGFLSRQVAVSFGTPPSQVPDWVMFNLALPWRCGLMIPGVMVASLIAGVLMCGGVHTYLFHPPGLDRRLANRAIVLSYYLCAAAIPPVLVIGTFIGAVSSSKTLEQWLTDSSRPVVNVLSNAVPIVFLLLIVNALARLPIALRLTTRCSWIYEAFAAVAWLSMGLICVTFMIGVVPWLIGAAWLQISSMM